MKTNAIRVLALLVIFCAGFAMGRYCWPQARWQHIAVGGYPARFDPHTGEIWILNIEREEWVQIGN